MKGKTSFKYKACFILFSLVFFIALIPAHAQQQSLTWSMALQNVKTGDLLPFSAPVRSFTGEKFRLQISPSAECYTYVIYENPNGNEVEILYAGPLKNGETWLSQVLELAPPKGAESFYVIASLAEQKTLDQRITAFKANSGSVQRRALMNEIFRLRSDVSKFKEEPEKPVLMGGASRGTPEKNQGVAYSGLDTYVKTISIEH